MLFLPFFCSFNVFCFFLLFALFCFHAKLSPASRGLISVEAERREQTEETKKRAKNTTQKHCALPPSHCHLGDKESHPVLIKNHGALPFPDQTRQTTTKKPGAHLVSPSHTYKHTQTTRVNIKKGFKANAMTEKGAKGTHDRGGGVIFNANVTMSARSARSVGRHSESNWHAPRVRSPQRCILNGH